MLKSPTLSCFNGPCSESRVSHAQKSNLVVLQWTLFGVQTFIVKFMPIYGFSTSSISILKISSLYHKILYHSMKCASFVMKGLSCFLTDSFFTSAKSSKVFSSFWDLIVE